MVASGESKGERWGVLGLPPQAAPLRVPAAPRVGVLRPSNRTEATPGLWQAKGGSKDPLPIKVTPTVCRAATGGLGTWGRARGPGLRLTSLREELGVNEFEGVFIHQACGTLLQQEVTFQ